MLLLAVILAASIFGYLVAGSLAAAKVADADRKVEAVRVALAIDRALRLLASGRNRELKQTVGEQADRHERFLAVVRRVRLRRLAVRRGMKVRTGARLGGGEVGRN